MWTDKAFGIWMGRAGEDAQVFTADEAPIDVMAHEGTRVLAVVRRDVMAAEATSRPALRDCEPEGIAA